MVFVAVVLACTYLAFSLGRVPGLRTDRVAAAVIGAVALLAARVLTLDEARASIDGATLGLLFGMMIVTAGLELSGVFALVGDWVTRRARTPTALLVVVSVVSAVLSAFLINDVVCIAFTPLVLRIAQASNRNARPYLLALATSSNIGSVATITGNPQNILIGSLSGIHYAKFAAALSPVAAIVLAANVLLIRTIHRRELDVTFVGPTEPPRRRRIYRRWVWKSGVVTAGVLVAFLSGVEPAVAALVGASVMLVSRAVDSRRLFMSVDWTLLVLFAGLFVVVEGVEKVGLAEHLVRALAPIRSGGVWGWTAMVAVVSNLVSNVPAVMLLKSFVLPGPEAPRHWLTLAMASTLAGNLTLTGSMATVIVVERAKGSCTISFTDFLKVGLPVGVFGLVVGAAWLDFVVR